MPLFYLIDYKKIDTVDYVASYSFLFCFSILAMCEQKSDYLLFSSMEIFSTAGYVLTELERAAYEGTGAVGTLGYETDPQWHGNEGKEEIKRTLWLSKKYSYFFALAFEAVNRLFLFLVLSVQITSRLHTVPLSMALQALHACFIFSFLTS